LLYKIMTFPTALENLNVLAQQTLLPPSALHDAVPASDRAMQTVGAARATVADILQGRDRRLLVVVGPCSIHDLVAARDYAQRLKALGGSRVCCASTFRFSRAVGKVMIL
jgi:3-deoxy-7-phosphoheptulonate synthase